MTPALNLSGGNTSLEYVGMGGAVTGYVLKSTRPMAPVPQHILVEASNRNALELGTLRISALI